MCEMLHAIPKQAVCSEDCAFYCMLYIDNYDAATGTVHWPYMVSVLVTTFPMHLFIYACIC
jgi:hypothetical protein